MVLKLQPTEKTGDVKGHVVCLDMIRARHLPTGVGSHGEVLKPEEVRTVGSKLLLQTCAL